MAILEEMLRREDESGRNVQMMVNCNCLTDGGDINVHVFPIAGRARNMTIIATHDVNGEIMFIKTVKNFKDERVCDKIQGIGFEVKANEPTKIPFDVLVPSDCVMKIRCNTIDVKIMVSFMFTPEAVGNPMALETVNEAATVTTAIPVKRDSARLPNEDELGSDGESAWIEGDAIELGDSSEGSTDEGQ